MKDGLHIYSLNNNSWYKSYINNNNWHRLNGPARIWSDGSEWWYKNNLMHRLDGPALIEKNTKNVEFKNWYYEGNKISCSSQEEFERLIKLKILW